MILIKSGQPPATHLPHKTNINTKSDPLTKTAKTIESTAKDHNIKGQIQEIHFGPVITTYEFKVEPGTPKSRVKSLENWLAKAIGVPFIQITKAKDKKNIYYLEVPNRGSQPVKFADLVEHPDFQKAGKGALIFGVDAEEKPVIVRLKEDLRHLLVVGNNGTEKARLIHTLLYSLMHSKPTFRMLLIDTKMANFFVYKAHPHLLAPVVAEVEKAVLWLQWLEAEVQERLQHQAARAKQGTSRVKEKYKLFERPVLVCVIQELADLMVEAGEVTKRAITRIVKKGSSVGVHLIVGTQIPSKSVIPQALLGDGTSQCVFQVSSRSEAIFLKMEGAEKRLGIGDGFLRLAGANRPQRVFIPDFKYEDLSKGQPKK